MWEIPGPLPQLQRDSSGNGRSNGTTLGLLFIHVYGAPAHSLDMNHYGMFVFMGLLNVWA